MSVLTTRYCNRCTTVIPLGLMLVRDDAGGILVVLCAGQIEKGVMAGYRAMYQMYRVTDG